MPLKTRRELRKQSVRSAKFDGTTLEEAISRAEHVCATLLNDVDLTKIRLGDPNDIYKIINALTGLTRARIEMSRWEAERSGLLLEARELLLAEFRRAVPERPELLEELKQLYEELITTQEERLAIEE